MAKGEQKGNREAKKPKKEKIKYCGAPVRPRMQPTSLPARRNKIAEAIVGWS